MTRDEIIKSFCDLYEETQIKVAGIHPSVLPAAYRKVLADGLPGIGEAIALLETALIMFDEQEKQGELMMSEAELQAENIRGR
jgi:hypothetical protein